MKFFLAKNGNEQAALPHLDSDVQEYPRIAPHIIADIIPVDESSSEREKCALLKSFLEKGNSANPSGHTSIFGRFSFAIAVSENVAPGENVHKGSWHLYWSWDTDYLAQLAEIFKGAVKIQVNVDVRDADDHEYASLCTISTKEMTLIRGVQPVVEDDGVKLSAAQFAKWKDPNVFLDFDEITVTVTIPDDIFATRLLPLPRKILEEEMFSDVTIVCEDGTEIKAHRNFLAAQSSVFRAMFRSDMKESRESTLEIPDMEEKIVRAFLKYLYYGDKGDAEKEFLVTLELFKAGHKYDVLGLEEEMKELILGKADDWFEVDGTVRLFMFARNLTPADEEIKMKAVKVLKFHSATLEESQAMQQVFRTDSKAAIEVLKTSFDQTSD